MTKKNTGLSEAAQPQKIKQYCLKIERAWNKTLEDIFLVGDLLCKARNELKDGETDDYNILINSPHPFLSDRVVNRLGDSPIERKNGLSSQDRVRRVGIVCNE